MHFLHIQTTCSIVPSIQTLDLYIPEQFVFEYKPVHLINARVLGYFTKPLCHLTGKCAVLYFIHQGGDVSPFPENNNPGEGFQTGGSEERAGEGHPQDGKTVV